MFIISIVIAEFMSLGQLMWSPARLIFIWFYREALQNDMKKSKKNTGRLKISGGYCSLVMIFSVFHWYLLDFDQNNYCLDKN